MRPRHAALLPAAVLAVLSALSPRPARAAAPQTFALSSSSPHLAFRLTMPGGCTVGDRGTCEGPAELAVFRKDPQGRASPTPLQTEHLANVVVPFASPGVPLVDSTRLYDDQGVVDVGDFDFDGREDFAVQVGHDGPYGGPTFVVYLDSPRAGRFVASDPLSELTRTTLGMFQVDAARRRLVTLAKSGCCWHETTEYEVAGGRPVAVVVVTEDAITEDGFVVTTSRRLVDGRWRTRTQRRARP
jgi:hypothetical protein